jgi:hypothetical protein
MPRPVQRRADEPVAGSGGGVAGRSPEEASDQEIAALEGAARALRRYEAEGRKLGGGAHYDRALEQAGRQLAPTGRDSRASRMDRVRLVEILQGSEAAEALLSKLD